MKRLSAVGEVIGHGLARLFTRQPTRVARVDRQHELEEE
jgi:hypothetical protein